MKRYEYDYFAYNDLRLKEALEGCNEMGKNGWELVSHTVVCYDSGIIEERNILHYYYFKREILCQNTQS